jgi:hypothetical protein
MSVVNINNKHKDASYFTNNSYFFPPVSILSAIRYKNKFSIITCMALGLVHCVWFAEIRYIVGDGPLSMKCSDIERI